MAEVEAIGDEFTRGVASDSASLKEHLSGDAASVAAADQTEEEDYDAVVARIRAMRRPVGRASQKLALPQRPRYHRHWFNDEGDRPHEANANGWSFIKGPDGKPIRRCVGVGKDKGALYAFAMELPLEIWLSEDMAARENEAKAAISAVKRNPFMAKPGEAKPSDQGAFYNPSEVSAPVTIDRMTR